MTLFAKKNFVTISNLNFEYIYLNPGENKFINIRITLKKYE